MRQDGDILMGEGDDDELHADPGDEQKSGELEFWTFVKKLDEDRGGKTHKHDATEAADEHDEELTGIHAADVAPSCLRQGDGERDGCENGIDGEGDVCDLNLGDDFPEFFFAVDVIALRIFRQFFFGRFLASLGLGFLIFVDIVQPDVDQIRCADGLRLPDIDEERDEEERNEAQHDRPNETVEQRFLTQIRRQRPHHDGEHEGVVGTEQPFHGNEHDEDEEILDDHSGVQCA